MLKTGLMAATLLASLATLPGCGPARILDTERGGYLAVRQGVFELQRELTVRAGRTRVYLQGGEVVPGVDEFRPHCQFEVDTLRETPQTVRPDRFAITGVSTRRDNVVAADHVQVAALETAAVGVGIGVGFGHWGLFGGRESRRMYAYVFRLYSAHQPDVRALTCGGAFDDPWLAELPTLQEIAAALGGYGRLVVE